MRLEEVYGEQIILSISTRSSDRLIFRQDYSQHYI